MKLLEQFAKALYRTAEESQRRTESMNVGAKTMLFSFFGISIFALFIPFYEYQGHHWKSASPQIILPRATWHVIYDAESISGSAKNFEDPHNPALWKSPAKKTDPEHVSKLQNAANKTFWIGAKIDSTILSAARELRANHLYLGYIQGDYKVWLDGQLYVEGDRRAPDWLSVIVPIERLAKPEPLHVAIEAVNNAGHPYPDLLGGVFKEGFSTFGHLAVLKGYLSFINRALPFAFFVANLLVALMFFLFWRSSSGKVEYFYLALYAIAASFYQLRMSDLVSRGLNLNISYSIDIFFRFVEGGLGMVLGLVFARSRPMLIFGLTSASLLLPLASILYFTTSLEKFAFNSSLAKWLVPCALSVGTLVCLLQAYYLKIQSKAGSHLPVRIKRLLSFALALAAIAMISYAQSGGVAAPTYFVAWYRFAHFIFIGILGSIVLTDYQDQEQHVRKSPVSEYHRRPVMPEKIAGCMLVADLKSSEAFYKLRALQGASNNLVAIWRSHFYTSLIKHGGIVINKKGDEIIGFFDQEKVANPVLNALHAIDEIASVSAVLEEDLRSRDAFPQNARGFYFRAAVTTGEIRPVWETMGANQREAYWEEAGTTSVFVESARLLESEKSISSAKDETCVILPEALASCVEDQSARLADGFSERSRPITDKHGSKYLVAVYRPVRTDAKKAA